MRRNSCGWVAVDWSGCIRFRIEAMFNNGFHGERAGDFSMCFAAHSVGKDEKVQRLDEPEAVLIVRADAAHIGRATSKNPHKRSLEGKPGHTRPDNPHLTLADQNVVRKTMRPTDYSRIDYTGSGLAILLALQELRAPEAEGKRRQNSDLDAKLFRLFLEAQAYPVAVKS